MTLTTKRLILRSWLESDAEILYRYASNPRLGPPAGWPAHTSVEQSLTIIREVFSAPETYAVILKSTNELIGCVGLKMGNDTDLTDQHDEAEIGYWVAVPHWGKGIAPEATQEIIRHAFENLLLQKIWCGYYDGNDKSRRVQEKCGFRYHHTTENVFLPDLNEVRIGHVSFLSREQWEKREAEITSRVNEKL